MPVDRLSALDVAFLCLEDASTPMHIGAVAIFRPREDPDPARLAALLAERAAAIPRLRRRVRTGLPFVGGARWEDDPAFDAAHHIGSHKLCLLYEPDPLAAFASHWIAEPLDLDRPLWSIQLVTGLPGGEFAVLLKFHHALADGAGAVELAYRLLDDAIVPEQRAAPVPPPPRSPLGALRDGAGVALDQAAASAGIARDVLRAARPYPLSPTATLNSPDRQLGFATIDLADVKRIRASHGGTTNDVVLSVIAGALRDWMLNRGQRADARALRALVPVSTRTRDGGAGGNVLSGYLCELPVDLDDPVARLHVVRAAMDRNKRTGPARGPGAIPVLANQLPSSVHRLATKVAGKAAPLLFDTVVTNVPLPGMPFALGGARLREVYPFVPLAPHQALGIALSGYRDTLHVGLQTNAKAAPDVGALADAVTKSTAALCQRSE